MLMGGIDEAVHSYLETMPIMRFAGVEVVSLDLGRLELRMPVRPELCLSDGVLHVGIVGMLADMAAGGACYTMLPPSWGTSTADHTLKLLTPAAGDRLVAKGRIVQAGRYASVGAADVIVARHGVERLCATALVTMRNMPPPSDE